MGEQRVLYLSRDDVIRTNMTSPGECNRVIEESFSLVGRDDFLMGGASQSEHGLVLHFPEVSNIENMPLSAPDYRYMAMVGYVGGNYHVCGTKVYGSNIANTSRKLPRSTHIIVLNDVVTGIPLALISGTDISNLRTGAVAAVGAKYLAPPGSKVCGLVGAGTVNRAALRCIVEALPSLERVCIYDRVLERSQAFQRDMADLPVELVCMESLEAMLPQCDIVHFAATAIPPLPWIEPACLKKDALVEISSLVDYPLALLKETNLVVDLLRMHEIWYKTDPGQNLATYPVIKQIQEGNLIPGQDVKELGKIVCSTQSTPRDGRPILFMANGLPVWDIALAYSVYQAAKEQKIGTLLPL